MLVLKIFPRLSKSAAFSTPGHANIPTPANHPCHTMMGVPRTALVLGGLAKPSVDCTQRAVSPPGRAAVCACDCIELGLFFFLFLQRPNSGCLHGFARVRGLHCSGTHYHAEWWSTSTKGLWTCKLAWIAHSVQFALAGSLCF
jgi:hypothetical protein